MTRKLIFSILSLYIILAFTACNSDKPEDQSTEVYSSAAVTAFSLQKNDKVLVGLDSVRFTIDLKKGLIYNADSLPRGTRVNRLLVSITSSASTAELTFRKYTGRDTTVNYLESTTDSIDFSHGPVQLKIVSADKTTSMTYSIKVNVHNMEPDSLYWTRAAVKNLPSSFNVPAAQKTVKQGDTFYCLTSNGEQYCLASTKQPEANWNLESISFPFTPAVEEFSSNDDTFFILDNEGNLYKSGDKCNTWQKVDGFQWINILGGYNGQALGVKRVGNDYYYTSYPAGVDTKVDSDFPVTGTSQLFEYSTKWSPAKQVIMAGGRNAEGKLVNTTWAYDGSKWANISTNRRICAAEGMCVVPYYTCSIDSTNWTVKKREVLLAFAGKIDDNTMNRDTYISLDLGFNWRKAGQLLQLPSTIPGMFGAQVFTCDKTMSTASRSSDEWKEIGETVLPAWYVLPAAVSRSAQEITEWETPYIYMFGGMNSRYTLYNTIWRGAISRLEFKPLQ